MKGDQAFFYHSNCKVPGIAGTLNVSQEHSVDGTYDLLQIEKHKLTSLRNSFRSRAPVL